MANGKMVRWRNLLSLAVASPGAFWLPSFPGSLPFLVSPALGSELSKSEGALVSAGCVGQGESLTKSLREIGPAHLCTASSSSSMVQ